MYFGLCLYFVFTVDGREFLPLERRQYCILCFLSVKLVTLLEGSPSIGIKLEILGKPRKMPQQKVEEKVEVSDRILNDVCEELHRLPEMAFSMEELTEKVNLMLVDNSTRRRMRLKGSISRNWRCWNWRLSRCQCGSPLFNSIEIGVRVLSLSCSDTILKAIRRNSTELSENLSTRRKTTIELFLLFSYGIRGTREGRLIGNKSLNKKEKNN